MRVEDRLRFVAAVVLLSASFAGAQTAVGVGPRNLATPVKDSSMLKPPAGAKIAVVEWTDMECPSCAAAFPVVHVSVKQYKVPLVHYDFLIPSHDWSRQAAVFARYLQDKVSAELAEEYRREVFASQMRIGSPSDLDRFTQQFMQAHGKAMPFVLDPDGKLLKKVEADRDLGLKMGLIHTPTIFVVTAKRWIDVADVMQLDTALDMAKAEVAKEAQPVSHTRMSH
jgi:protein-disulfide isomerase